jgi:TRAP-type mannitol/chloroaromatic compound transport system permease small subunit
MNALKTLCRWIDTVNEWIGEGVAWVTLGLVAVVFVDVVMRYLFNTSYVFTQELEWHLFGVIFLMGAIIYQRLGPIGQAWTNLIGVIFFALPGCIMVVITSWKFTHNAWLVMEGSPDPGGIPLRFLIKGTITVGFLFLTLQSLSMGIHSLFRILGIEKPETEENTS